MRTCVIHCVNGLVDRNALLEKIRENEKKLGKIVIETNDVNEHYIKIEYRKKYHKALSKIVKKFAQTKPLDFLKKGHKMDGKFLAHHCIASKKYREKKMTEMKSYGASYGMGPYGHLPTTLATHYEYPAQQGVGNPTIAIISLGGTYLTKDLQTYWNTYLGKTGTYKGIQYVNTDSGSKSGPNQKINSKNIGASQENALDIEIVMGMCPNSNIKVYFGSNSVLGFYTAFNRAIADNNKVISCSWGAPEISFGSNTVNTYNSLFKIAAQRGISICVASGDHGSGDGISSKTPVLDFPSCCQYVVSCGGTSINLTNNTETVWSWNPRYGWGGGGGLSAYLPALSYQTGVVSYPTGTTPPLTVFNGKRSSPDIAMNADPLTGWTIYFNGRIYISSFGGTSCVSPAFSAYLGLINRFFNTRTHGVLDFLYSRANTTCYRDITVGTNNSLTNSKGVYDARVGYDQCTGLGSIKGTTLLPFLLGN